MHPFLMHFPTNHEETTIFQLEETFVLGQGFWLAKQAKTSLGNGTVYTSICWAINQNKPANFGSWIMCKYAPNELKRSIMSDVKLKIPSVLVCDIFVVSLCLSLLIRKTISVKIWKFYMRVIWSQWISSNLIFYPFTVVEKYLKWPKNFDFFSDLQLPAF